MLLKRSPSIREKSRITSRQASPGADSAPTTRKLPGAKPFTLIRTVMTSDFIEVLHNDRIFRKVFSDLRWKR